LTPVTKNGLPPTVNAVPEVLTKGVAGGGAAAAADTNSSKSGKRQAPRNTFFVRCQPTFIGADDCLRKRSATVPRGYLIWLRAPRHRTLQSHWLDAFAVQPQNSAA
jgi:hypothetical protein